MSLLLENYNSVKHSSTGFSPLTLHTLYQVQPARDIDVIINRVSTTLTNVAKKMLTPVPPHQARVKKGDIVRISARTMTDERKNTFRKHYFANWSVQLYTVESVSPGTELSRPQFKLATKQGHIVKQRFYRSDLQLVDVDSLEINEKKRPDYSAGSRKWATNGRHSCFILSPSISPLPRTSSNRSGNIISSRFHRVV